MRNCSRKNPTVAFSPNVYLTINPDGTVLIVALNKEMGTGIRAGLHRVLLMGLEADWKRVKLVSGCR
ncbi:MAG: hypothetical protein IPJ20_15185 [Flammeovirgaceae bacterium]|nr:hypothetical protein [Flammeovirgaceae bacterium]